MLRPDEQSEIDVDLEFDAFTDRLQEQGLTYHDWLDQWIEGKI